MNVALHYLYRDASNYKKWNIVVFSNQDSLSLDEIENQIKKSLIDGIWFYAENVRLPLLFLWMDQVEYENGEPNEDDVDWHEYSEIEFTDKALNDEYSRDITNFLNEFSKQKIDPYEKLVRSIS